MGKDQDLLHYVKLEDTLAVQKMLIKAGRPSKKTFGSSKRLNVNYQDSDGMSSLHQASLMGNTSIMWSLLESGASVNMEDNKGMLALHYAAWQGKPDPVYLLLQKSSHVNTKSKNSDTALHLAAQHGHLEVVNLLLQEGADPTICNGEDKSALDLACEFGRYNGHLDRLQSTTVYRVI